jgi:serine-type D-Ala-D-Ala carboxypeptidase (penicillin-binding protein 5/6)
MRRLAARLLIAGCAMAVCAPAAGCAAAPGRVLAQVTHPAAQEGTHLADSPSAPVTARVPASARSKMASGPTMASGPRIDVVGAPQGVLARSGILVDATTGQVLWNQDENTVRPIASITKVMTALVVIQAGGLNQQLAVPAAVTGYIAQHGADAAGLIPGQTFTVDQLLHIMLVMSAADAAYTLANAYGPGLPAFITKMNAEAAQLGLTHTHFTSPDGLPYPTETSTYSTAAELVQLGEAAMSYPEFRSIVSLQVYSLPAGDGHDAVSVSTANALLGNYQGAVGIKTGFTDAAGRCLLFEAVRGGRVLIGDVLGSPSDSYVAAAQDAAKVLDWAFALKQAG